MCVRWPEERDPPEASQRPSELFSFFQTGLGTNGFAGIIGDRANAAWFRRLPLLVAVYIRPAASLNQSIAGPSSRGAMGRHICLPPLFFGPPPDFKVPKVACADELSSDHLPASRCPISRSNTMIQMYNSDFLSWTKAPCSPHQGVVAMIKCTKQNGHNVNYTVFRTPSHSFRCCLMLFHICCFFR